MIDLQDRYPTLYLHFFCFIVVNTEIMVDTMISKAGFVSFDNGDPAIWKLSAIKPPAPVGCV